MEHPGQAVDGRDHVQEYEHDGRREGDREEPAEDFMSDLTRHGTKYKTAKSIAKALLGPLEIAYFTKDIMSYHYRMTRLLGNNLQLPLTWIWNVPPSCLGSR